MTWVRHLGKTAAVSIRASAERLRTAFNLWPALSVRQLLTLLVLLTTLPLLALALLASSSMIATEQQANRGVLMSKVRMLASLVDNEIATHSAVVATLATSPALQTGDFVAFKQQALQALAVLPGAWITVSEPDGTIVMSTLLADGVPLPPRTTDDALRQAWSSRQPQVTEVLLTPIAKRFAAFLEVPTFKDGRPLYSIRVSLGPDRFLALLRTGHSPESVVGLVDRNANFVARIPDHATRVGTPAGQDWRAAMAWSREGFAEGETLEGDESIIPYVKTTHGWTVGIAQLKRFTEAPVRRHYWTLGLIGGALTLLGLAFALTMARKLSSSMHSLLDASRTMAEGKTVAARELAVHEATEISRTLSATSETLAARTAELSRANDTFENLVTHAPFGVYVVNSEFRIVQISRGATSAFTNIQPLLGRDLAEVMRAVWPEKFAEEAIGKFRQTLATGEHYHQSSLEETRLDTGNDEAYDWQIERVVLSDGKYGVVCYFYDYTALKQAENAKRESDLFTATVLEASPDCLKIGGFDGRLQFVNQNGACLLEVDNCEAVVDQPWEALWPLPHRPMVTHAIAEAKAGRLARFSAEAPTIKGAPKVWDVTVAPIKNAKGTPIKFIASSRDVTENARAEAALRESEIRFRQTFENTAVGVAHVGLDGQWLEVNQTLCDILEYSREELQTKTVQDVTHPDDLNAARDNVRRLVEGELQTYGTDQRYIRKDGSRIWGGLTVALRRDAAGAPLYFISIVRDISERKAAQEHQEFLLGELAHRLKNQLAIVQAMAGQTARNAGSLKQFLEKFSERVQGLAVATDVLVRQGWSGAQLGDLIQRQLKPFVPMLDRLECDGPNVTISADATQTIGLALHELATNAVKHGAWSSTGGRVKVSWQFVTNGATGNNLRVTWVEEDGPVVVAPTRKGFGHVVIENMVAQRVGGEAKLEFAPEGLSWTLTMPNCHIVADPGTSREGAARASQPKSKSTL